MNRHGLPPIVGRLVRLVVPGERVADVLADLEEGHAARRRRSGERAARRWLWREAFALVGWRLVRAVTARRGAAATREGRGAGRPDGGSAWARDLTRDIRYGIRVLGRRPGFTVLAVLVLGLGIGAPTTVFSLVNRIFFERPPLVEEPHRLVRLFRAWEGGGGGSLGNPDYEYYRDAATTLSGLAATAGPGLSAVYSVDGEHFDQLLVERVSDNFFDVLGVRPVLGREFLPEENRTPGTHPVVVLGHAFWVRAFGADPGAIGTTMTLNGDPYTILGVMPEAYRGISPGAPRPDVWIPNAMTGRIERLQYMAWWRRMPDDVSRYLQVIGRLAPGVTFEAAEAELSALHADLAYEGKDDAERLWVRRQYLYSPSTASQLAGLSRILMAVVGMVLAIAAANVAVLLLSRASSRDREIGIRTAMGAGRGRITRQLLAEALLLGTIGGGVGIAIAFVASDLAATLMPISIEGSFAPDWRVVTVAVVLTVATSLAVGAAPALHAVRSDLRAAIGDGRSRDRRRSRARGALVVAQLSLSVMLVSGALLFARSFQKARAHDVGFATEDRLVAGVQLRNLGYEPEEGLAFIHSGLERIAALPGVEAVSTTRLIPFGGAWTSSFPAPPGAVPNAADGQVELGMDVVSPGYFEIMQMEIVRGRPIGPEDVEGAPFAFVINEALAQSVWPGEDPVGLTLPVREGLDATIVGIVADAEYYEFGEDPVPHGWASVDQLYQGRVAFLVQTGVPATGLAGPVQSTLREIDPSIAFSAVTTLEAVLDEETARYEVTAVLVGLFGGLALLLAATGLYGVVSFLVTQRTHEIGVRMALGADRGTVARDVLLSGGRLVGIGLLLGAGGAVALRRLTESYLYGLESSDPVALAGAASVLVTAALAASLAPARRATLVDPMVAIRTD